MSWTTCNFGCDKQQHVMSKLRLQTGHTATKRSKMLAPHKSTAFFPWFQHTTCPQIRKYLEATFRSELAISSMIRVFWRISITTDRTDSICGRTAYKVAFWSSKTPPNFGSIHIQVVGGICTGSSRRRRQKMWFYSSVSISFMLKWFLRATEKWCMAPDPPHLACRNGAGPGVENCWGQLAGTFSGPVGRGQVGLALGRPKVLVILIWLICSYLFHVFDYALNCTMRIIRITTNE